VSPVSLWLSVFLHTFVLMNALYAQSRRKIWVGDGSTDASLQASPDDNGIIVALASGKPTVPFTAYQTVDGRDTPQAFYFVATVTALEGHLSVGVATPARVRHGYQTRGLFYNGNLTNGAAALRTSVGPYVQTGSRVGILWESFVKDDESTRIRVFVYVNDVCVGVAFDVAAERDGATYCPCLHVTGKATVRLEFPETVPTVRTRQSVPPPVASYVGEWQLAQALVGPELGELPLPMGMVVVAQITVPSPVDAGGRDATRHACYRLSIKVANTLHATLQLTGDTLEAFDGVRLVGSVASTRMMGPPPMQALEQTLCQNLPTVTKMKLITQGWLLSGPTMELHWVPHETTLQPVTAYL
jgi:hypothetical protein